MVAKRLKPSVMKWIQALRSGEYKQTTGALQKTKGAKAGYCCLGVACVLYNEVAAANNRISVEIKNPSGNVAFGGNIEQLPMRPLRHYGLSGQMQEDLIDINDKKKKNFNQIADYIEAEFNKGN